MITAERIAVLTGAGISTASGIPDFRGPQGLWTKNPAAQAMFDIDEYVASRAVRVEAWKHRLAAPAWTAEPNAGHRALVDLERQGRLTGLITQNVDGLHQKAGSKNVLELHGTVWFVDCLDCTRRIPMAEVLPRLESGDEDPACETCGGILKSATVSFGQNLDPTILDAAVAATRARCSSHRGEPFNNGPSRRTFRSAPGDLRRQRTAQATHLVGTEAVALALPGSRRRGSRSGAGASGWAGSGDRGEGDQVRTEDRRTPGVRALGAVT